MDRLKLDTKGVYTLNTRSAEETQAIAESIGRRLNRRTLITLTGDLGSGKTAFVQGLAKGLDVPADYYVTSPTYNIINEYPGRMPLYHLDLYRLSEPEELYDIGLEEILEDDGIVAVEWPDRLPEENLPPLLGIEITITKTESRTIKITVP